ncbi:DUF1214 domain-containing protein [Microbacterium hydrocarbonoxydans]|uniref:Carboxylesterase n=1 Tax=Microbacterium hydrocarbonoxydans TaxID=273678 RepID=A0A1H4KST8_9MICO|nr:DUF1214 domain-containing protein [Microbacterium hydrocarbonoxydans]SEB61266.1 Protein of unknown function [Microbacterium hydrocarbonoxydans]
MTETSPVVTYANFARIETLRMFAAISAAAGGANRWNHYRIPTPIDQQTVIRMNRDTLYSAAIIDVAEGATITIPDTAGRYVSVMLVSEDHYINRVLHEPGEHRLSADELGSGFVLAAARILVDSDDPDDVATVNALQDQLSLASAGARELPALDYDADSFTQTRDAVLTLAKGLPNYERAFGPANRVDPIRHLLGTASGWGGLPEEEAFYVNVEPGLPVGRYELTVGDVPVDGFWSVSLYNAEGYFEPNDAGRYSVNSVTGVRNADGSVTVRFGGDASAPNALPLSDGWNYLVRLYRPRPEVLGGSWTFPSIEGSAS